MAKTKALISCAVTAHLICVFVFAYANRWFIHAKTRMECQKLIFFGINSSHNFKSNVAWFLHFVYYRVYIYIYVNRHRMVSG